MKNHGECRRDVASEPVHDLYCGNLTPGVRYCWHWHFRPTLTHPKISATLSVLPAVRGSPGDCFERSRQTRRLRTILHHRHGGRDYLLTVDRLGVARAARRHDAI